MANLVSQYINKLEFLWNTEYYLSCRRLLPLFLL